MLAASDLATVPLFSATAPEILDRLARSAADVRLEPGEYAAHEGDERALFAVLSGKIEVTKLLDGIERPIGFRSPGQIFGEVPIVFGIVFQGNFRAAEPSRVVKIEASEFHTLADASPNVLPELAALARERMG